MATPTPPADLPPHDEALERARVVRGPDRRQGPGNRRHGPQDRRRRGRPDRRAHPVERRLGAAERRSGRPDRRLGGQRRLEPRPERTGGLDPALVFWAGQLLCWGAIVAVVLIWGF